MPSIPNPETALQPRQGSNCAPTVPSALLVQFWAILPNVGFALDLACGSGRNTLYLARHGLSAMGIDRSRQALQAGREVARRANLKASFVQADLTRFDLPTQAFSVIICFKYRSPKLYPSIRSALRPGGLLLYETYTCEQALYRLKPRNPEHLLKRGELYRAFGGWEIIFYREAWLGCGTASLVARSPVSAAQC